MTPYLTQQMPPALVATLPPIVDHGELAGSGGYHSPYSATVRTQVVVDHPGLDDGEPLHRVDAQHLVHAVKGDHDAAIDRVGAAGQAGPRAARDHGHAVPDARPHDVGDFRGRLSPDHGDRLARRRALALVTGQAEHHVRIDEHPVRGDVRSDLVEDGHPTSRARRHSTAWCLDGNIRTA